MREALFIKQNTERWQQYEQQPAQNPDELAERFIAITDDLAYAKTFYPNSKTTAYLNALAAGFHQSIYKNKKEKSSRFVSFWSYELPMLFKTYQRQLLYSFIFFVVFCTIGVFSAKYDNSFSRFFLGDSYVEMTNQNIAKGDPFGVYKSMDPWMMFLLIAKNNLQVTVMYYLFGITFCVGSLFALMKNGIMLGVFEYLFFSKGLGIKSLLVIWIHGTLEMSSMIIACAAGLAMGNSLIFPKTFTRMESLKKGAMDGLKITLGILPLIVIAATFESFVTRHTEMPLWLSILILGTSLVFMIWYVIIYPNQLNLIKKNVTDTNATES